MWKDKRAQYKKLISEAKKKCITDKIDTLCENDSWNRAWEMLRSGKGEVRIWREDATYTTERTEIDDNLLRKSHPRCNGMTEFGLRNGASTKLNNNACGDLLCSETAKKRKSMRGISIPNEALKATIQTTVARLAILYTNCIKLGYFHKVWKKAKVVWIISLLPAYGRVLDKLLDNRLRDRKC